MENESKLNSQSQIDYENINSWEIDVDAHRQILTDFLERWPEKKIKEMTLEQYVGVKNKDTFCQWLETKTRMLGSIKGVNSSKFGIYKREDPSKKPKKLVNDNEYSWQKFYSDKNRNEAFNKIKKEILQVVACAKKGHFEKIDKVHLTRFVKWKIAYLYSNERLIPIFKKDILEIIANHFDLAVDRHTTNSEIQKVMIENKPTQISIYEYSEYLYRKFGKTAKITQKGNQIKSGKTINGVKEKNISTQLRQGGASYIATQRHNELQEILKEQLVRKYGRENVILEKDYVDITVFQSDKIILYEIKSSSYAEDCIREALGQILSYSYKYKDDKREKELVVAGQYKPSEGARQFIDFLKNNLKLKFQYENIEV